MVQCDFNQNACPKPAVKNYQKIWVRYGVNPKTGAYSKRCKILGMEIEEPTGEDNLHFCKEHADIFEGKEDD